MTSQKIKVSSVGSKQRGRVSFALLAMVSILATGCLSEEDEDLLNSLFASPDGPGDVPYPGLGPSCFNQRITQPEAEVTKKLDLLFVTDTSGSLDEERGEIADGIDAFIAALPQDVDFRIGVMLGHGLASGWSGKLYKKGTEPFVLDSETQTLTQIRTQLRSKLVNPASEYQSDGGEVGLYSLHRSMAGTPLQNMKNQGFMRADAALAVVFIADENDICYPGQVPDPDGYEASAYQTYCANSGVNAASVYSRLREAKGDLPLVVAGLVYTNNATLPHYGENEKGLGYLETIALANGLAVDLANGDYEASLAQIGTLTTVSLTLITDVILIEPYVITNSITVKVDGQPAAFTYNPITKTVHLLAPGGAESVVDITYCTDPNGGGGGGCTNPSGCGGGGGIGV